MTPAQHYLVQSPWVYTQDFYINDVLSSTSEMMAYTGIRRRDRPQSVTGPRYEDGSWGYTEWYHQFRWVQAPLVVGKWSSVAAPEYMTEVMSPGTPESLGPTSLPDLPQRASDELVNRAILKALKKLRDQKVDLGVALAEAKETAEFFSRTTKRAANLLESAYRRNPREWLRGVSQAGRKGWKNLPNYYLEHCYALTPLISDIQGAAQALSDSVVNGNRPSLRVVAEVKEGDIEEETTVWPGSVSSLECSWVGTRVAKVGIYCDVANWVIQEFDRLGLENPLSILWEKKAYSFVIDQFLPVGDWISTMDVGNYLQFRDGFITRTSFSKGNLRFKPTQNAGVWTISEVLPGHAERMDMSRERLTSLPHASFPSLRNPLSLGFVASSMALLTQVVGKHKALAKARFPFT